MYSLFRRDDVRGNRVILMMYFIVLRGRCGGGNPYFLVFDCLSETM